MLRLVGLAVSIGLADSLNPSTIGPALYLSTGQRARGRVMEFTIGVFIVYFLGGVVLTIGPGQLLRSLVPHPSRDVRHIIELVVGVAMLAVSALIWRNRQRLARRDPPDFDPQGRSSWYLGAAITAVELPTAFPYFAVIAAIVAADLGPIRQLVLLLLFNICFVLPLLGIIATLAFAGESAEHVLARCRQFLQRKWPVVLSGLLLVAGVFVVLLGATGLASTRRGRFGHFARRFGHVLRP